jgi:hypothetical protein
MAISKNLTIVFTAFYIGIIIYVLLFFFVPDFQAAIIESRRNMANFTEGTNYFWAIMISIGICLIGNASIGFPIPFPFVLFSFSNSVYMRYIGLGLSMEQVFLNGFFWIEIMGIAIAGGLGSSLGEITSFLLGRGAKIFTEKVEGNSQTLENMKGFGKVVLENPQKMYFYIFVAAALPIPDDPLWISLGLSDEKINFGKCILYGWLGKNITTIFYVLLPILILIGVSSTGMVVDDTSSVITEALMLIGTLTIMFFILSFNWTKYLEDRQTKAMTKRMNKIEATK